MEGSVQCIEPVWPCMEAVWLPTFIFGYCMYCMKIFFHRRNASRENISIYAEHANFFCQIYTDQRHSEVQSDPM